MVDELQVESVLLIRPRVCTLPLSSRMHLGKPEHSPHTAGVSGFVREPVWQQSRFRLPS